MWVVKIGGSLGQAVPGEEAPLRRWLELLTQLGGGRLAIVPGGGTLADEVRRLQSQWKFGDLPAHNMAVLAMAQNAYLMQGLFPDLQLASSEPEIRHVLRKGRTALWMPLELRRERPDDITSWQVTADSLALGLASRLQAERLVLVKRCAIDRGAGFAALGRDGIVDERFASLAAKAPFEIELLQHDELARMRSLLLGEARVSA